MPWYRVTVHKSLSMVTDFLVKADNSDLAADIIDYGLTTGDFDFDEDADVNSEIHISDVEEVE